MIALFLSPRRHMRLQAFFFARKITRTRLCVGCGRDGVACIRKEQIEMYKTAGMTVLPGPLMLFVHMAAFKTCFVYLLVQNRCVYKDPAYNIEFE